MVTIKWKEECINKNVGCSDVLLVRFIYYRIIAGDAPCKLRAVIGSCPWVIRV
jgi:hypothetical protein